MGGREQRRFRRFAVNLPCKVKARARRKVSAASELDVSTQDISRGGFYFQASGGWEIGTTIECTIQLPSEVFGNQAVTIRCRGKVARLVPLGDGGLGVGATIENFRFVRQSDKALKREDVPLAQVT
ncbi:MAG: PilZ domain-containing protein [Acidobacteria bacterium]|nr:PilZ domain-containing protein [Acidobacteriota bacterium]